MSAFDQRLSFRMLQNAGGVSRRYKLRNEALCFQFLLIHQNLGANFGVPKTGYQSQKQPVLSPDMKCVLLVIFLTQNLTNCDNTISCKFYEYEIYFRLGV